MLHTEQTGQHAATGGLRAMPVGEPGGTPEQVAAAELPRDSVSPELAPAATNCKEQHQRGSDASHTSSSGQLTVAGQESSVAPDQPPLQLQQQQQQPEQHTQQQLLQQPQGAAAGSSGALAAAASGPLARESGPSFSGWSGLPGQLQCSLPGVGQHSSSSSSSSSDLQQQQQQSDEAIQRAAEAAAAHGSALAKGARVRRKSSSDVAPHRIAVAAASRRRNSDSGLYLGMAQPPACLAAASTGGSTQSSSGDSLTNWAGLSVGLSAGYLASDLLSCSSASSQQQHQQLCSIMENAPMMDAFLSAPGSPGRLSGQQEQEEEEEQQEQQRWQQQHQQLEREVLQHEQLIQQKRLQLERLKQQQQQHDRRALSPCAAQGTPGLRHHSPTPPGGVPAFCMSPRGALVHKQLAQDSSAAAGSRRRAATEPPPSNSSSTTAASSGVSYSSAHCGRSPGAAAMVMTTSSSGSSSGSSSLSQPQQQQYQGLLGAPNHAATAVPSSARAPPVARDITQQLQLQRPAAWGQAGQVPAAAASELQTSSIWGGWPGHEVQSAQHGSLGQQHAAAASSVADTAASAADQCHRLQQQQQEAAAGQLPARGVGLKPKPARSRSNTNFAAKSPAPPLVPPSPHQQHAAELRIRRSSCSSIPAAPGSTWPAPSPRTIMAGGSDHVMGQVSSTGVARQLDRAASGSSSGGASRLLMTTPDLTSDDTMWAAHAAAHGSPACSLQARRQAAAHEQRDVQEGPLSGFLMQQEQLLLGRDQGPSTAVAAAAGGVGAGGAGRSLLAAEGSISDALDQLHGGSSSLLGTAGQQQPASLHTSSSSREPSDCGQPQQPQHAGIKALANHALGPHRAAAAAAAGAGGASGLPPPHPSMAQHFSDMPGTPRSHLLLSTPGHATPRSAAALLGSSGPGLPQQPVPPKQHAPSCRSPCVSVRVHAPGPSPGPAAEAWLHHTCSPILEQGPYQAGSNPSSSGSNTGLGFEGRAGAASRTQPDRSDPGSSGSTHGVGAGSAGAGAAGVTPDSSGSSRGARAQTAGLPSPLPRPAFDYLARSVSLDSSLAQQQQQQQHSMRAPSPPAAPDAIAALLGCSRPVRALSPVVRKQAHLALACTPGKTQQPQLQVAQSPSPPPMLGSHAVQPCPPANSLPPVSPSPAVKTRVLAQPSSQAAVQQGEGNTAHTPGGSAAGAAGAGAHAELAPAKLAWSGSSPVLSGHPAPRGALSYGSSSSSPGRVPAAAGHAAMLPSRDSAGSTGQGAVVGLRCSRPDPLLQPSPPCSTPESGSGTPVVAWMQPARQPNSCLSSFESRPDDASRAAAAAAGGAGPGEAEAGAAAGWAAVTAFGTHRGRLGYLMNSGVVGVLFEDASHMLVQADMATVSYIQPTATTAAAAGAAAQGGPAATGKAKDAAAAGMGRSPSTDLAHSDQSSPAAAAATTAAGHVAAAAHDSSAPGASAAPTSPQLYRLPAALDSSAGSSSRPDGHPGSSVPEHLASKLRCLQRFVGCLLHHQPYSSKRQLDVTRLSLPGALALQQQPQPAGTPVYVQHFNASEGCVLLSLTDGSQQLVFMSDRSVLLLRPGGQQQQQQLAYVTPPRRRKHRPSGGTGGAAAPAAAPGDSTCSDLQGDDDDSSSSSDSDTGGRACPSAELVVVQLGGTAGALLLQEPGLLARLKQASRLPGVLPLPLDVATA